MKIRYDSESVFEFMFNENWIEAPLYYNNPDKTIRFDLESRSEIDCYDLLRNVFNDLFGTSTDMIVAFYCERSINRIRGRKYFKLLSLNQFGKKKIISKMHERVYSQNEVILYCNRRTNFKLEKYLEDYFNENRGCEMAFIAPAHSATLNLYDRRGFDLLSEDPNFLEVLKNKYSKYLVNIHEAV